MPHLFYGKHLKFYQKITVSSKIALYSRLLIICCNQLVFAKNEYVLPGRHGGIHHKPKYTSQRRCKKHVHIRKDPIFSHDALSSVSKTEALTDVYQTEDVALTDNHIFYPRFEIRIRPNEKAVFIRPFIANYKMPEFVENDFLYPFGQAYLKKNKLQWQFMFSLFSYTQQAENEKTYRYGNFFPFYFFKSGYGKDDYHALWPVGGQIKNFFGKKEISWVAWPLFAKTLKEDSVNYWLPWPFINIRKGKENGFGFYPIGGHFYGNEKDEQFFLWPLGYDCRSFKMQKFTKGFLPFYAYQRTPNVKDISIIWPFFGHRIEKNPAYEEHRLLWPLFVQGRGDQRNIKRWAPFYTYSDNKKLHTCKRWFLWPLLKICNWEEGSADIHQEQLLYFLYWHQRQKSHTSQQFLGSKTHFWPFYSYWYNGKDRKQMQVFSPFEVFFQNHKQIRDIYTPLFNIYRYDKEGETIRESFFFNCIQLKRSSTQKEIRIKILFILDYIYTQKEKCFSLLKGLLEFKKEGQEKMLRLFWVPIKSQKLNHKNIKNL